MAGFSKKSVTPFKAFAPFLLLIFVFSCGRSDSPTSSVKVLNLTGVVQWGPVQGAEVSFFELFENGEEGKLIGSSRTDNEGAFEAVVENPNDAPYILVKASGGVFANQAFGEVIENDPAFASLIAADQGVKHSPVTPLTDFLAERALLNRRAAPSMRVVMYNAAQEVAAIMGIKPEDIFSNPVTPQNITASSAGGRHAMAVIALREYVQSQDIPPESSLSAVKNLAGYFSGTGSVAMGSNPDTFSSSVIASYKSQTPSADVDQHFKTPTAFPPPRVESADSCSGESLVAVGGVCCNPTGCDCQTNEDEMYAGNSIDQGERCGDNEDREPRCLLSTDSCPRPPPPPCTIITNPGGTSAAFCPGETKYYCTGPVSFWGGCAGEVEKKCVPKGCSPAPEGLTPYKPWF